MDIFCSVKSAAVRVSSVVWCLLQGRGCETCRPLAHRDKSSSASLKDAGPVSPPRAKPFSRRKKNVWALSSECEKPLQPRTSDSQVLPIYCLNTAQTNKNVTAKPLGFAEELKCSAKRRHRSCLSFPRNFNSGIQIMAFWIPTAVQK